MSDFLKGRASNNQTADWDILDGNSNAKVAAFSHTKFNTIQNGVPICYAIPLGNDGLSPKVWLQSEAEPFVALAMPSQGLTQLAKDRIEERVHRTLANFDLNSPPMVRLRNRMTELQIAADNTPSKRLNARSL